MNTLSVSTYSLREQFGPMIFDFTGPDGNDVHFELPYPKMLDLSQFPQRAKDAFGVDSIETVSAQFAGIKDPELDRFAADLLTSGVQLMNVAIDVGDLLATNPERRETDIALSKRWIDRFAAMGANFVRLNPGSPFAAHTDAPPQYLADALGELGDYAQTRGSRLLVENHGGPGSDPTWMSSLLDSVGHDRLGLLLDLGNFDVLTQPVMAAATAAFTGQPLEVDFASLVSGLDLTPLYDGIDALATRAELVHVKVNDVDDEGTIRAVDLGRALGILGAHDYAGPLTVEYEGSGGDPWQKTATIVDFVRAFTTTPALDERRA